MTTARETQHAWSIDVVCAQFACASTRNCLTELTTSTLCKLLKFTCTIIHKVKLPVKVMLNRREKTNWFHIEVYTKNEENLKPDINLLSNPTLRKKVSLQKICLYGNASVQKLKCSKKDLNLFSRPAGLLDSIPCTLSPRTALFPLDYIEFDHMSDSAYTKSDSCLARLGRFLATSALSACAAPQRLGQPWLWSATTSL